MQLLEEYKSDMRKLKTLLERGVDYRTVAAILAQSQYILKDYPDERKYCFAYSKAVKDIALRQYAETLKPEWDEMYWQAMLWEAPELFESYLFYMEKNRAQKRKFYTPRRRTLKTVVDDLQDLEDGEIEFYGLSLPPRVGKAISFDTPVLTDHGWKRHGDLTILDRVIGIDGEFKRILAIHNPCYMDCQVTFSDGEKIACHENHEWRVFDRHSGKVVDKETKEIIKTLYEKDGRNRYLIPEKEIMLGSHKPLWVTPYALGAWLGDGRNTNPDICGAETDYPIIQKIIDDGYELAWDTKHKTTGVRYYGFRNLRNDLQKYGMCHSRRKVPKHIPDDYLTADIGQRLELLAGLLDTDGYLNKKERRYQFTTNEPLLRDNFISLIGTFGWRTSVTEKKATKSSSGISARKNYWVISFNPTMYIPCQLERKQLTEFSKQRKIAIEKIEKVDRQIFGNCITVEDGVYCVGKTLKPTHNSTMCIFFISWIMGKRPNSHNAMSGHSGILADGFYGEILNLIMTQEYTFHEIFPLAKLDKKSADKKEINLDKPDRFATLTCRGIDGTWTGSVDISSDGYLYVDDLVRDRTESLSPTRLANRYQDYLNVLVDRKNDGAKELMVGTRWNVFDPLGVVERENKHNPRYRFRKIPALNENDESNFDYDYGVGFSTQYYIDMRERLEKPEWMAKFQQNPFVREGLLFPENELHYFDGTIPEGNYKIVAAIDPAFGGGDSVSMPICLVHENGKKYIIDWMHNKGSLKITIPLVRDKIMRHDVVEVKFEKNNGGELYCKNVQVDLVDRKYNHCHCYTKSAPVRLSKEEKINAYADYIKDNFLFLLPNRNISIDDDGVRFVYKRSDEYDKAIDEMTMYTSEGRNEHDDSCDALTQLAMMFEDKFTAPPARVIDSPY